MHEECSDMFCRSRDLGTTVVQIVVRFFVLSIALFSVSPNTILWTTI